MNIYQTQEKTVQILSFGYKYGVPTDVNYLQDVRFLPNPYYVEGLKSKSGLCPEIQEYVKNSDASRQFLSKLKGFMELYIEWYFDSGKESVTIAIGCTGGKHRSVAVAQDLYEYFLTLGYSVSVQHRDIEKDK